MLFCWPGRSTSVDYIILLHIDHLYLFCDALTLECIFGHGELPLFALLVAEIRSLPWMHCSRMGNPELYKPLNWKVVLDGSGIFGNGRHTVLQRWTLLISRVCFFLFEIVLHMFKNCSDFSLTSLLWYTHLELIVLFQKIAKQDGGRCEMAVYALQCSNLKHILPVCTDWEVCCDLGYFFLWLLVCDPSFSFLFIASLLVSLL